MVRGLETFKKYFEAFPDNYVIIGGTACDIILGDVGYVPRATKDIDIILVVEALTSDFVSQFWKFIAEGNYDKKEKSDDERKYYRFAKPGNPDFPFQIELFSRKPELLTLDEPAHLTPVPAGEGVSSLSAILLDDDYYHFILQHSILENGLHRANMEAVICLKAKAYLEIADRIAAGSKEDERHLRKHKGDVFRLGIMLRDEDVFMLPANIKADLQLFIDTVSNELPGKKLYDDLGSPGVYAEIVLKQIIKSFMLVK